MYFSLTPSLFVSTGVGNNPKRCGDHERQRDRHQSVLDYLNGMGERFAETAATFEREAGIAKSTDGTGMWSLRVFLSAPC